MGFNRDVIRRRRDEMHELGVRVRWAGRAPRLWRSVIKELQVAEELTKDNDVLTLTMCVNYGGRAEIADAVRAIAREVAAGRVNPERIDPRIARHLYVPEWSEADLIWRTSGEQRLSNYMTWQAAYSEFVFSDVLWPDVDRTHLWAAIEEYARRDRRYGSALSPRTGSCRTRRGVTARGAPGAQAALHVPGQVRRDQPAGLPEVTGLRAVHHRPLSGQQGSEHLEGLQRRGGRPRAGTRCRGPRRPRG